MLEKKKRGRPRNNDSPKTLEADSVIGRSVWTLADWGFPLRSKLNGDGKNVPGVCELVGLRAKEILQRSDANGLALGPDRIEQVFELWFAAEQGYRSENGKWPLRSRWRYTKASLCERIPDKRLSLDDLIVHLLKNAGHWIGPRAILPGGDLILSPKAERLLGPTPKFNVNGVEK